MITTPIDFLVIVNIVLGICVVVGGFSAFRNGRQTQLARFQKDTNDALTQRIAALEGKIIDFEKENVIQRHLIETITDALKKRGLVIAIDGDLVTIEDMKTGLRSTHRKRTITTTQAVVKKEEA